MEPRLKLPHNPFSRDLQDKIDKLIVRRTPMHLGHVGFSSPLLLAPMSAICSAPFRLLMEDLGAGGTVSELVSCHGINYGNEKTKRMLTIDEREENIGLQLFGEDPKAMSEAAKVAEDYGPKFIDINMGCPVRKVVTKGGGSALMKDTSKLGAYFGSIKAAINIPLTIKIRTGWDQDSRNALEIIRIAREEGVEFVAVHGRTRTQQYRGQADWDFLEFLASESPLPIIGNGDLHSPEKAKARLKTTRCQGLMLGRGPLRNPFIFLDSYLNEGEVSPFTPADYIEITQRLFDYTRSYTDRERTILVQLRKHVVWFAAGFAGAAHFRNEIFKSQGIDETLEITENYFKSLMESGRNNKQIDPEQSFMAGGHG
ncbi:MAG: tRNA dihydrouridine synthase DusB [Halobacteriovorax sp.]|nr:tRNA dihydrouridine synthase DusB [Halobacteriovorax sp.]|tara:strand:- start:34676 stop:35785 length:1110 start_codon:yes stop_codon:yes gene_type:complete